MVGELPRLIWMAVISRVLRPINDEIAKLEASNAFVLRQSPMPPKYDIFLSYASVDNTALAEPYANQTRWVTAFKVALQQAVDTKLGRTDDAKWFFDAESLRTGDHLADGISQALESTSILVALVSPGYFHEDSWCKIEREHFLKILGANPARTGRVYAVLLEEEMRTKWQELGFGETLDFAFYDKNSATGRSMRLGADGKVSTTFMERISTLAIDIAAKIQKLRTLDGPPNQPCCSPIHGSIVLAAVPGEIEERRTELANFLTGKGWQVLPERNECDADTGKCAAATKASCKNATAFIQLLSRFPWKPGEFDRVQFQAALDSGMVSFQKAGKSNKPFFRYRSDDFSLAVVNSNPEHKRWLQEYDVAARSMPTIKEEIGKWLDNFFAEAERRQHQPPPPAANCSAITLSVSSQERTSLGRKLSERLEQESLYSYLPSQDIPDLSQCFDKEHGFVAVFGNEIYTQRVEQVLKNWRELWMEYGMRRGHWPPMAVFLSDPPPDNKDEAINVSLPDMEIIRSWDDASFKGFVTAVQQYSNQRRTTPLQPVIRV
jgi:TIR domain